MKTPKVPHKCKVGFKTYQLVYRKVQKITITKDEVTLWILELKNETTGVKSLLKKHTKIDILKEQIQMLIRYKANKKE